jgi:2-oxoglutarate dehydrogenase E1 component
MAALLKEYLGTSYLFGANAPFIEELYESYLTSPDSVPQEWRRYFDQLQQLPGAADVAHEPIRQSFVKLVRAPRRTSADAATPSVAVAAKKQVWVLQLANNYRRMGLRHANLDPLKRSEKPAVPELDPAFYGLEESDMEQVFNTASMFGPENMPLREIVRALRETYCGTIGAEFWFIADGAQRRWIQQRLESIRSQPSYSSDFKRFVLDRLTAAETLEKYLHTRYVGQKRFSLEGGDTLIPLLDHLLQQAGEKGVQESVIGMAHRGRLNVLVNTMARCPRTCSPSSKASTPNISRQAMSSTTWASRPTSTPRAGPCTCRWPSILRTWRSSIQWSRARSARASTGAKTAKASRFYPSSSTAMRRWPGRAW